ncbi:hypothetical protein PV326_004985 [Microctonus aethiopoides]|nr:hypothetical protein PV326_004985 [Microctonus aethiopoides]
MGKGVLMLSFITLFVVRNFSVQGQRTMANSLAGIYSVAYVTVPNNDVAKKIAHGLVSEKLAACVNIIPQITSIYEWENKITEDNELLLMIKTRTDTVGNLTKYVKENHPYTVCEVISLPIENGNEDYLNWIGNIVPSSTKTSST